MLQVAAWGSGDPVGTPALAAGEHLESIPPPPPRKVWYRRVQEEKGGIPITKSKAP